MQIHEHPRQKTTFGNGRQCSFDSAAARLHHTVFTHLHMSLTQPSTCRIMVRSNQINSWFSVSPGTRTTTDALHCPVSSITRASYSRQPWRRMFSSGYVGTGPLQRTTNGRVCRLEEDEEERTAWATLHLTDILLLWKFVQTHCVLHVEKKMRKCCARMMIRYSIFGAYLMELEELRKVKPATLLRFTRTSKRFS